jgi:hypothetical protein
MKMVISLPYFLNHAKNLFKLNTGHRAGFLILFLNYPEYGFIQTKDNFS